jgi:hypothetical protein
MGNIEMFALNIRLLIGLLLLLALSAILLIVGWTLFKVVRFHITQQRGQAKLHDTRTDEAGRNRPPTGVGLCDRCQKASDQIVFLRDGRRLCPACAPPTGE